MAAQRSRRPCVPATLLGSRRSYDRGDSSLLLILYESWLSDLPESSDFIVHKDIAGRELNTFRRRLHCSQKQIQLVAIGLEYNYSLFGRWRNRITQPPTLPSTLICFDSQHLASLE
jgi:hypothetical protein